MKRIEQTTTKTYEKVMEILEEMKILKNKYFALDEQGRLALIGLEDFKRVAEEIERFILSAIPSEKQYLDPHKDNFYEGWNRCREEMIKRLK